MMHGQKNIKEPGYNQTALDRNFPFQAGCF